MIALYFLSALTSLPFGRQIYTLSMKKLSTFLNIIIPRNSRSEKPWHSSIKEQMRVSRSKFKRIALIETFCKAGNARDSRFHRKRVIFVEKSFTNSNSHSGIVCAKTDSIAPLPQTARQCKSASPPKKSAYFSPCFQFLFLLRSGMLTRSRLLI